jgi:hypothetical protein
MAEVTYVQTQSDVVMGPGTKPKKSRLTARNIWIWTIIILIIIVIVSLLLIFTQQPEDVEIQADPEILNLDELFDLSVDGQCCIPASMIPNERWIYSPSDDFTYTLDIVNPNVVCQNELGSNLQACLAKVSNEDGTAKIIGHKGITYYYGFSPGQAINQCISYGACI